MVDFVKYHALGNDYLIIEPDEGTQAISSDTVRRLCDRRRGVGADGVLFGPTGPVGPEQPIELSIFNSDGTVCERSANGLRLFALHLAQRHPGADAGRYVLRTMAGDCAVQVHDRTAGIVGIDLAPVSFDAAQVPVLGLTGPAIGWTLDLDGRGLTMTALHNGNPHTVLVDADASPDLAHELGPRIAGHPRFPGRVNVEFVRVVDRATIEIEVWERGAGYTLSSGSGGWAAANAVRVQGLVDERVTVRMPGGELTVDFRPDGSGSLTGAVERLFAGRIDPMFRHRLD